MNRLGLLYPSELNGKAREFYDSMKFYTHHKYGNPGATYLLEDGRFVGPFAVQLHTPEVGEHFLGMAVKLQDIPGLSLKNREIVILVVGAKYQADYELYAHKVLALNHGITEAEIESILRTECPRSFSTEERTVYDATCELVSKPGPLSEEKWRNLVAAITKDGATAVVQYAAFYSYVATILNGFDCRVPEQSNRPALSC